MGPLTWYAPADAQQPTYMVVFDDPDHPNQVFFGWGAEEAAKEYWEQKNQKWNCHLLRTMRRD